MRLYHSLKRFSALLMVIGLLAAIVSPAASATWTIAQVVEIPKTPNLYPQVVTSPSGDFYLAYKHSNNSAGIEELKILKWNGSNWVNLHTLTPSTPGINITGFLDYLSLVVRSDNDIHLAFRGYQGPTTTTLRGVRYGRFNGTSWSFDTVAAYTDSNGFLDASQPTLAVDNAGNPHLAYVFGDKNGARNTKLEYAVKSAGIWNKTTLLNYSVQSEYVRFPSIALDSAGHAYLAYTDSSTAPNTLYLSTNATGSWERTALVTQEAGKTLSMYDLLVDSAGKVHLTFTHFATLNTVRSYYGTNASGSWIFDLVPGSATNDNQPRLSQNSSGILLLSYISFEPNWNGFLKVAHKSGNGDWQVEQVDTSINYTGVTTGAVNNQGQLMVIEEIRDYTSSNWKRLWYATTTLNFTQVTSVAVPANGTYRAGQALNFTVTFNENVTVNTSGGTPSLPVTLNIGGTVPAAYASGSGTSVLIFTYTVASGNLDPDGISLGAALALNGGTIKNGAGTDANLTLTGVPSTTGIRVDAVAPLAPVVLTPADGSATNDNTPTITGTAEANSTVTVYIDIATAGTTTANGSGAWTFTTTTLANGNHSVQASARDEAGNNSQHSSANFFTVDTITPKVSLSTTVSNPTNAATIPVTVTFSEPVSGFASASISAQNGAVSGLTGSGQTYTFNLTPTGQGWVRVQILPSAAQDSAGNASPPSNQLERVYDSLRPALFGIARADSTPTNADLIHFTVSLSEPVSGVDVSDFALTYGGLDGPAIQSVTGSGDAYNLTITTGSGSGYLRLDLAAGASITDPAGNPLVTTGAGWQDDVYTGGEVYEIDKLIPVMELLAADKLPTSGNAPFTFTVRFSDDQGIHPSAFGDGNFRLVGTDFDQLAILSNTNEITAGKVYEVTYQVDAPVSGWASLTGSNYHLVLEADQVSDEVGNWLSQQTLGNVEREKYILILPFIARQ